MKKLTKIATATTLGLGLSVSAMASGNIQTTSNLAVLPSTDLSYAFDDSQDLQVMVISNQEMAETEGAVAPLAAYGIRMGVMGTIGAGANTWNHYHNTGEFSWGAAGRGFVAGAVGGGAAKFLGARGW